MIFISHKQETLFFRNFLQTTITMNRNSNVEFTGWTCRHLGDIDVLKVEERL